MGAVHVLLLALALGVVTALAALWRALTKQHVVTTTPEEGTPDVEA